MRKIQITISIFIIFLLALSTGYCDLQLLKAEPDKTSPPTLTIKSDKQMYAVGDDIWIEGFIKNNQDNDWEIGEFLPGDALLNFWIEIINEQNEKAEIRPMIGEDGKKMKEAWLIEPSVIKPGETVKAFWMNLSDFLVGLASKDNPYTYFQKYHISDFMQKGTYAITCRIHGLRVRLGTISNTITIEVKEKEASEMLPRMMKGWELYSWNVDNEWHFTLILGTNRNKTYEEIILAKNNLAYTVKGIDSIKAILKRLPKGESVFWATAEWPGIAFDVKAQLRKNNIALIHPPEEIMSKIRNYCEQLGVELAE